MPIWTPKWCLKHFPEVSGCHLYITSWCFLFVYWNISHLIYIYILSLYIYIYIFIDKVLDLVNHFTAFKTAWRWPCLGSGFGLHTWTRRFLHMRDVSSRRRPRQKTNAWWRWRSTKPLVRSLWWALSCSANFFGVTKLFQIQFNIIYIICSLVWNQAP